MMLHLPLCSPTLPGPHVAGAWGASRLTHHTAACKELLCQFINIFHLLFGDYMCIYSSLGNTFQWDSQLWGYTGQSNNEKCSFSPTEACFPFPQERRCNPLSPQKHFQVTLASPAATILHQMKSSDPGGTPWTSHLAATGQRGDQASRFQSPRSWTSSGVELYLLCFFWSK